ncbi:extracellular solute-binding protein [Lactobacillus psittaci]|uniref:ABC transporter, substrate-binding protein n=1 Tax=Lactobacillus psittaci DSM 15354 TaxID=1122152 RepID=A0A0R1RXS1_9LACO|nr:extracellular solute-binding protein [Lactobacillus psittaci]KRL61814.1 ABC transporter, substrate-binding protein [Lactobacillus psittaci DSM 15354]
MNIFKKLVLISLAGATLASVSACSKQSSTKSQATSIPKVTKKTTVVFWHGMSGIQGATLAKLTQEFEKKNPNITIKLEHQGSYINLQSKINSTLQSPNNLPTITQAYPGWLYNAAKNKMLVDLKPYINDKNVGWGSENTDINTSMLKGARIDGTQYGMPFNKSVEALTYNADLLKKYGVKVPKTMAELKKAAKTIYEKSHHKVVGAGFDVMSNYYLLGLKDQGINFSNKVKFDSKASKKVINYYAEGVKEGYFRTAGSEHYLSGPLANGKVAMYVGTSAGEGFVKKAIAGRFQYGVAARPSTYNMQQGTDIYMFSKASAMQKAAAFKYIKFLLSKSSQLTWANATGYVPVNTKVVNDKAYKNNPKMKTPAIIADAMKHLYSVPVAKNSNAAYTQAGSNLEAILAAAAKKQNYNSLIKQGQAKLDAAWKQ